MADMDIDELENLAQRVEVAKHQVCNSSSSLLSGPTVTNFTEEDYSYPRDEMNPETFQAYSM